jgi:glycine/D-amino acid oxidase-like deaminating enzyme
MSNAKVIIVGGGLSGLSGELNASLAGNELTGIAAHTVLERGGNVVCTVKTRSF